MKALLIYSYKEASAPPLREVRDRLRKLHELTDIQEDLKQNQSSAYYHQEVKKHEALLVYSSSDSIGRGVTELINHALDNNIPVLNVKIKEFKNTESLLFKPIVETSLINEGRDWKKYALIVSKNPTKTEKE